MASNKIKNTSAPSAPAESGFNVVISDSVDCPALTRALYVGGAGDVVVEMSDGTDRINNPDARVTLTFKNVPAGTLLPIAVHRVRSTGTSATLILGLY